MVKDLKIEFYYALVRDVKKDKSDRGFHYLPATMMQGTVNGETYYASEVYDDEATRHKCFFEEFFNGFFKSVKEKNNDVPMVENLITSCFKKAEFSDDGDLIRFQVLFVRGTYNGKVREACTKIEEAENPLPHVVKLYNRLIEDFEYNERP